MVFWELRRSRVEELDKDLDVGLITNIFLIGQISSIVIGPFSGAFVGRLCSFHFITFDIAWLSRLDMLVLGRVIAGAYGSIMATAFESWMVTKHHNRGYPSHLLGYTFRMAVWASGTVAVVSGILAEVAVSAFCILLLGRLWNENYGDHLSSAVQHIESFGWILFDDISEQNITRNDCLQIIQAWRHMMADSRLIIIALVQTLFEGCMFTWILIWVPVLQNVPPSQSKNIALGTVFSTLMMAICAGSSLFKIFTEGLPKRFTLSPNACLIPTTGLGAVAIAASSTGLPAAKLLLMFLVYEVCIGIYFFPAMATCRSTYMDDRVRGTARTSLGPQSSAATPAVQEELPTYKTLVALSRVPMNLVIVLLTLGPVSKMSDSDSSNRGSSKVFEAMAWLTGLSALLQVMALLRDKEGSVNHMALVGQGARVNSWESKRSGSHMVGGEAVDRKIRQGGDSWWKQSTTRRALKSTMGQTTAATAMTFGASISRVIIKRGTVDSKRPTALGAGTREQGFMLFP